MVCPGDVGTCVVTVGKVGWKWKHLIDPAPAPAVRQIRWHFCGGGEEVSQHFEKNRSVWYRESVLTSLLVELVAFPSLKPVCHEGVTHAAGDFCL